MIPKVSYQVNNSLQNRPSNNSKANIPAFGLNTEFKVIKNIKGKVSATVPEFNLKEAEPKVKRQKTKLFGRNKPQKPKA